MPTTGERLLAALAAEAERITQETVAGLQEQLAAKIAEVKAAQTEIDRLAKLASGYIDENGALTAKVEGLTAEAAKLRARIAELEQPTTPPAVEPSPGLWFRIPDGMRSQQRKSFPHHFGPFPPTVNNKPRDAEYFNDAWMKPGGEGGKHDSYGGFLRDRPLIELPIGPDLVPGRGWDFRMLGAEWEIRAAAAGGHDGFMVDIMGASGADSWDRYIRLRDVAVWLNANDPAFKAEPFTVIPMLDTNGSAAKSGDMNLCADRIAQFFGRSSTWTVDGRPVFSSFKLEGLTVAQWQQIIDQLAKLGHRALFLSSALDYGQSARYASVTWGEGSWGFGGDPGAISGTSNQTAQATSRGKVYMLPINTQNVRPNLSYGKIWEECGNTEAMRASYAKAIAEGSHYVQQVTWSDFGEGAQIVPSESRGWAPLDLGAWYLAQWKTGKTPEILRDAVILSHRSTPIAAKPTGGQTNVMTQRDRPNRTAARDTVEALTFLTAPAQVTITTAAGATTYNAPAGEHAKLVPLAVGAAPKVEVRRDGKVVAAVESPIAVRAATRVDDRGYYWFNSIRGTAGQRIPYPHP